MARIILQVGDTLTDQLRELNVDVTAFLHTALQFGLVEVGESAARVFDAALQLVTVGAPIR